MLFGGGLAGCQLATYPRNQTRKNNLNQVNDLKRKKSKCTKVKGESDTKSTNQRNSVFNRKIINPVNFNDRIQKLAPNPIRKK